MFSICDQLLEQFPDPAPPNKPENEPSFPIHYEQALPPPTHCDFYSDSQQLTPIDVPFPAPFSTPLFPPTTSTTSCGGIDFGSHDFTQTPFYTPFTSPMTFSTQFSPYISPMYYTPMSASSMASTSYPSIPPSPLALGTMSTPITQLTHSFSSQTISPSLNRSRSRRLSSASPRHSPYPSATSRRLSHISAPASKHRPLTHISVLQRITPNDQNKFRVDFNVGGVPGIPLREALRKTVLLDNADDAVFEKNGSRQIRLVVTWPGYEEQSGVYVPVQDDHRRFFTRSELAHQVAIGIERIFKKLSKSRINPQHSQWSVSKGGVKVEDLWLLSVTPAAHNMWVAELEVQVGIPMTSIVEDEAIPNISI
ncbi:hypothetical protein K474DRAFT_1703908 [Panus rudis PR-1116 ss-1]|nr:hypothetical protein K474DRAFT_1703908 [Panus rudis PR-1116 ss-1]